MNHSMFSCDTGIMFYIRDGRAPTPHNAATSRVMSANRGRDTSIELLLRRALWREGVRGYRVGPKGVPGRPDIVFPRKKVAIFVHGCFWHACPKCALATPKTHSKFWNDKFARNKERDARKISELKESGWRVLVAWEHDIKRDLSRVVRRVIKSLA